MSAAECAARGAGYLDDHEPGWYDRIDLDDLNMADECRCILGQLCGTYVEGLDIIDPSGLTASELGFWAPAGYSDGYAELDEHWAREITSRRWSAAMHADLAHGAELRAAKRIGRALRWFGSEGDA